MRGRGTWIWNLSASLNTWYGVTTDNDGRVTALHLDGNNLHGRHPLRLKRPVQPPDSGPQQQRTLSGLIPPDLSGLTDLKILHLDENRLRGSVAR